MMDNFSTFFAAVCYCYSSNGRQRRCRRQFVYFISVRFRLLLGNFA